ncbi:MAG TPA: hypothetical protein VFM65_02790 [Flavobacteriaceae bacterium]|nr:hypothetical protein [Flavobacteriaceae bacterium]
MKKTICLLFLSLLFMACDDGDIIVTTFDFDSETQLSLCGGNTTKVIYAINDEPIESISFNFENEDFDGTFDSIQPPEPREIAFDQNNELIYRTYNAAINGNDYFCVEVPPSTPVVLQEYTSTSGGSVFFSTTVTEQDDEDSVPSEAEDRNANGDFFDDDFDGDGIPDFIDVDDDNDNVPTSVETVEDSDITTPEGYPDTDGDGDPNYLDEDDDDDGTITRYEDLNAFDDSENVVLNPGDDDTDGDGTPNYLDVDDSASETVDLFRQFEVSRTFRTRLVAKNVTMQSSTSNESITFETLVMGYLDISKSDTLLVE